MNVVIIAMYIMLRDYMKKFERFHDSNLTGHLKALEQKKLIPQLVYSKK